MTAERAARLQAPISRIDLDGHRPPLQLSPFQLVQNKFLEESVEIHLEQTQVAA